MSKRSKKERGPLTPKKRLQPFMLYGFADDEEVNGMPDFGASLCYARDIELAEDVQAVAEFGINGRIGQFVLSTGIAWHGPYDSLNEACEFAQKTLGVVRWMTAPITF